MSLIIVGTGEIVFMKFMVSVAVAGKSGPPFALRLKALIPIVVVTGALQVPEGAPTIEAVIFAPAAKAVTPVARLSKRKAFGTGAAIVAPPLLKFVPAPKGKFLVIEAVAGNLTFIGPAI